MANSNRLQTMNSSMWTTPLPVAGRCASLLSRATPTPEAKLADAVEERGTLQLVVLGAGFDTIAYRNPFANRLKVFEVDHPATQAWKQERPVGIAVPDGLTYAGVDFERQSFAERLLESHFEPGSKSLAMA
jgi:methyltransferase (TIGR00027 family)